RCRRQRDHPHAQGPASLCRREICRRRPGVLPGRARSRPDDRDHLRGRPQGDPDLQHRNRGHFRSGRSGGGAGLCLSSRVPEFEWQFTLVLLTNGVMIGLMYALIALGFVLIYKATDAINFAQGEFVMFAGFIAAGAADLAGAPFWVSALLSV